MTRNARNFTLTAVSTFAISSLAILFVLPSVAHSAVAGPPQAASAGDRKQAESDDRQDANNAQAAEEKTRRKTSAVDPIGRLGQGGAPGSFEFLGIAGAIFEPKSPFSNKLKANDFKQIQVSYDGGRFFAGTLDGIGFRFVNSERASGAIAIDDNSGQQVVTLDGDYRIFGPIVVSAGASFGISDHQGNTYDASIGIDQPLTTKLEVSLAADITYVDGKTLRRSTRALLDQDGGDFPLPFKINGGFQSFSVNATIAYQLTDSLELIALAGGQHVMGDTRRLLRLFDKPRSFQPVGGIVLAYVF